MLVSHWALSSSWRLAENAIDTLRRRFIKFDVPSDMIQILESGYRPDEALARKSTADNANCDVGMETLWIPLPYHYCWYQQVARAVAQFNDHVGYQEAYRFGCGKFFRLRIAWCNMNAPLSSRVQRHRYSSDGSSEVCPGSKL